MIGHCSFGFYAQASSRIHDNRLTLEFNGYPLATADGITSKTDISQALKLPSVGYFQVGDTFWGFSSRELAAGDIPNAQPSVEAASITGSNEFDSLLSRYISRHGTRDALITWISMGGRIYPTAQALALGERNLVPKWVRLPPATKDSKIKPPKHSLEGIGRSYMEGLESEEAVGSRSLEAPESKFTKAGSIKKMFETFHGLPTTLAPQPNYGAGTDESLQWDIDSGSEARRLRLEHYRKAAKRTWSNHVEERRKIQRRTPEYDSEDSIDKELDIQMKSGVRPRRMPLNRLGTKAIIYEFSSSDENDRKTKRVRLAERRRGEHHLAVCRDVGVMDVVIPNHPLRYFSALVPDCTPPPESGPIGGTGLNPPSNDPKLRPGALTPRPPGHTPYSRKPVEGEKKPKRRSRKALEELPVEQPGSGSDSTYRLEPETIRLGIVHRLEPETTPEPGSGSDTTDCPDPETVSGPEPRPGTVYRLEPEATPEPGSGSDTTYRLGSETLEEATPSPKAKGARKNRPKAKVTEDLSEQAFMTAKHSGLVCCSACGTLLKALKLSVSVDDSLPCPVLIDFAGRNQEPWS